MNQLLYVIIKCLLNISMNSVEQAVYDLNMLNSCCIYVELCLCASVEYNVVISVIISINYKCIFVNCNYKCFLNISINFV